MLKYKKIFISCCLLIGILLSTNGFTMIGSTKNSSSNLICLDSEAQNSDSCLMRIILPSTIKIDNNFTTKFNLGDRANAYIYGNKIIILSSEPLGKLPSEATEYKKVENKYMYIFDIQEKYKDSSSDTKIIETQITIPAKSKVELKDNFLIVNNNNPLPKGYSLQEEQLVDVRKTLKFKCMTSEITSMVRSDYVEELKTMFADASKQGIKKFGCGNGYRSYEDQTELFNYRYNINIKKYKDAKKASEQTQLRVANPGTSEHNIGLALDILQYPSYNAYTFENTAEAKWLNKNCYDYGFMVRYPNGKSEATKIMYEPWHFRYVGKTYAQLFKSSGLCFEEIENKLRTEQYIPFSDGQDKYILFYSKTPNLYCSDNINAQRSIFTYSSEYVTLIKI